MSEGKINNTGQTVMILSNGKCNNNKHSRHLLIAYKMRVKTPDIMPRLYVLNRCATKFG